ncbi:MAG: amidohydrolase family protein [bacterium]|nr:amidohydrolase family protein [bacterium]
MIPIPLTSLALACVLAAPADHKTYLSASHVHVGDGTILENGVVVVEGGKITAVGGADLVPDGHAVQKHEGHLSAGMVSLRDAAGVGAEGLDRTRNVMPDADLAWAFDPKHPDWKRLTREGVTSVVIVPRSGSLIGGLTAVVKPATENIVKRRSHLHVSLSSSGLSTLRYPTSYPSAIAELDSLFGEGGGAIGAAKKGELPVLIEARGKAEVQRAVAFAKRHGLKGSLLGPSLAGELAESIKASGLDVILVGFGAGQTTRSLASASLLSAAGVSFGFTTESPGRDPVTLRLSVAAAMRGGLDAAVAWRAVTADAARIAGVADRVGTIAAGKDADLVLWSGAPTELASRVESVWVDGSHVYDGGKN